MSKRPKSRKGLILRKALVAFCAKGYDGTAISEIADEAGVSKAAVSFHFASKEDLLAELVTPLLDELDAELDRYPNPDWPGGVWELTGAYFSVLVKYQDVATWVDADRSVHARPEYGGRLDDATERLVLAITGGSASPRRRVRALAAIGGLWRPLRMLTREEINIHRIELLHAALVSYAPFEIPAA